MINYAPINSKNPQRRGQIRILPELTATPSCSSVVGTIADGVNVNCDSSSVGVPVSGNVTSGSDEQSASTRLSIDRLNLFLSSVIVTPSRRSVSDGCSVIAPVSKLRDPFSSAEEIVDVDEDDVT